MTTKLQPVADNPCIDDTFDEYLDSVDERIPPEYRPLAEALRAQYDLASQMLSLRKSAKLTQIELAAKSGVNQSAISRLERGNANLTLSALNRVADALGMRIGFVPRDGIPA